MTEDLDPLDTSPQIPENSTSITDTLSPDSIEKILIQIPIHLATLTTKVDTSLDLYTKRLDEQDKRLSGLEKKISEYGNLGNIITIGTGIGVSILLHVINTFVHGWTSR